MNNITDKMYKDLTILRDKKTVYPDNPDKAKLEVFENPEPLRAYTIEFETNEFTSVCPITNQPDYGVIVVNYVPDRLCLESKSLKLYLFSYRNFGGFAEKIINRILDDIVKACAPRRLSVSGSFTARGGITIKVAADYLKPERKETNS